MLAHRIIPVLLRRGAALVKGIGFDSWRVVGHASQAIRVYQARDVDELIVLDVTGDCDASWACECFMPVTVGGGIKSVEDIRRLMAQGADKVAICTAAHEAPDLIDKAARKFGSQAIVIAIDVLEDYAVAQCGKGQRQRKALDWAREVEARGAGEILLTSIERDGTLQGYDLSLIETISAAVSIPVVAAGGAGTYEHLAQGLRAGAHAVAAGALWQFCDATPKDAGRYLKAQGFAIR